MSLPTPDDLLTQLQWRYATKKFDPARKIPEEAWRVLEKGLVLSPSSFGLQPWKFFVVQDPALRAQIKAASWNQSQVVDCSHFVVFARKNDLSDADVDRYITRAAAATGAPAEVLAGYGHIIKNFRQAVQDLGQLNAWCDRQLYIALGSLMTGAALLGIDTCPMEGMDPSRYDEILGLTGSGYSTVVACAAGYRATDDAAATRPKVRYDEAEVLFRL